jgi:hypothetical protein
MTTITADAAACFKESDRIWHLRRAMNQWRADREGGLARLLADLAEEFRVPPRLMTHVYVRIVDPERLRPNACAFRDLDAYVAMWRDALIHALCVHQADEAACAQARAPKRGHPQFKANKAYALRAWRRNAERMLERHWPTRV